MSNDKTRYAIQQQLTAFGNVAFYLQVIGSDGRPMVDKQWSQTQRTAEEVLAITASLQRMNCDGGNIFIRPANSEYRHFVLLDDIPLTALPHIKKELHPVAILETSPKNHQAWVLVEHTNDTHHLAMSRAMAERYGCDKASTDAAHFGRLAGFTNRKPKHATEGLHPFVRLQQTVLANTPSDVAKDIWEATKTESALTPKPTSQTTTENADWSKLWGRLLGLQNHIGHKDESAREFHLVKQAIQEGMPENLIASHLAQLASARDKGDASKIEDYVSRTINNAKGRVQM